MTQFSSSSVCHVGSTLSIHMPRHIMVFKFSKCCRFFINVFHKNQRKVLYYKFWSLTLPKWPRQITPNYVFSKIISLPSRPLILEQNILQEGWVRNYFLPQGWIVRLFFSLSYWYIINVNHGCFLKHKLHQTFIFEAQPKFGFFKHMERPPGGI